MQQFIHALPILAEPIWIGVATWLNHAWQEVSNRPTINACVSNGKPEFVAASAIPSWPLWVCWPVDENCKLKRLSTHFVCEQAPYLVSLQPIQQCDTNDGSTNASMVRECTENGRLHFNVDDTEIVQFIQIVQFIAFAELTECTIQATLSCAIKTIPVKILSGGNRENII